MIERVRQTERQRRDTEIEGHGEKGREMPTERNVTERKMEGEKVRVREGWIEGGDG